MQSINDTKITSVRYFNTRSNDGKRARLNAEGRELRLAEVREFLNGKEQRDVDIHVLDSDPTKHHLCKGVILSNNFLTATLCPKCLTSYIIKFDPFAPKQLECLECGNQWERKAHQGRPKGTKNNNNGETTQRGSNLKIKADATWLGDNEVIYGSTTKNDFALMTLYRQSTSFIKDAHQIEAEDITKLRRLGENQKVSPKFKEFVKVLADALELGDKMEAANERLKQMEVEFRELKQNAAQYELMVVQLQAIKGTPETMIQAMQDQASQARLLADEVGVKLDLARQHLPAV